MSILVNKDTRVVISGITGNTGSFHTRQCMEYGSKIVAGVTPGKGGMLFDQKVPVFNTIRESVEKEGANACAIFVPPAFAAGVIAAVKNVGLTLPLVVRLEGTNVELGRKMLSESGIALTTADSLADAAEKIVKIVAEQK